MASAVVCYAKRAVILLVAVAAIVQWSILLERFSAAIWGWYKFLGYGGGGQITVGKPAQLLFFLASAVLAIVSFLLSCGNEGSTSGRLSTKLAKYSGVALAVGMVFWVLVLVSPLVVWRT